MQVNLEWNQRMEFQSTVGSHHVSMDAKGPLGANSAQTPKELVASGLCGCTAMDVIALMRKHKQEVTSFHIKGHFTSSAHGHPAVFTSAKLDFLLEGTIDPKVALEAVHLSQTQYCGISAMLAHSFPITWEVFVNHESHGTGKAKFGHHE